MALLSVGPKRSDRRSDFKKGIVCFILAVTIHLFSFVVLCLFSVKMKLNSCSTLFQGKHRKGTEQGDSAFFGNKTKYEGSTASQTEEQIGVYKNLTSWRFWSEHWEACSFKTVL